MMDDVEQKAPRVVGAGLVHDLLALVHEGHPAFPARGIDGLKCLRDRMVMTIVGIENFLHRGRRGHLRPLELAVSKTIAERDFLAHNQPRNLTRGARFRVGSIGRSLGNAREHLARRRRLFVPELEEVRFFVHQVLQSMPASDCIRRSAWHSTAGPLNSELGILRPSLRLDGRRHDKS